MYLFLNRFYHLIPILSSALLMLIFSFNSGSVFNSYYTPSIAAICVYFWAFHFFRLISVFDIFIVAIISDFVNQTPLGTESAALLLAYFLTISQRDIAIKYGFSLFWIFFGAFLGLYSLIKFVLLSLYFWELNFDQHLFPQFAITFLLFPLIHRLLSFIGLKRVISLKSEGAAKNF